MSAARTLAAAILLLATASSAASAQELHGHDGAPTDRSTTHGVGMGAAEVAIVLAALAFGLSRRRGG